MNFKILNIINTIAKKLRFFTSFKFLAFSSILGIFGILTLIFPEIAEASGSFWGAIGEGAVSVVSWIIGGIINFIIVYIEVPLLKKVLDITAGVLANTDVMNSPLITGPWSTIRDITNIAFIGILIVISLMNIIGIGADRYSIQAAMPKFIFAVVAVNFSKLFCTVILDLFNVVSASLYNLLMGQSLGKYGEGLPKYLNNFYKFNDDPTQFYYNNISSATQNVDTAAKAAVDISNFSVDQVIIAVVLGILIMGFMGLTFTFLVRMVWLWILTVTSPIYFLGMSVSIFGSLQKMWWDKFLKYALIPVKVAAILSVGLLIHNNLMQEMSNTNSSPTSFSGLWRTFWHPEDINNVVLSESSFIIGSLIVAGVCYAAFKAAHDDGIADSVNGWFKNKFPKMALGMTDKAMKVGSNVSYGLSNTNIPGLKKVLNPLGKYGTKVFDAPYKLGDAFKGYTDLFSRERKDRVEMGGAGLAAKFVGLTNRGGLLTKKMEGKIRGHERSKINERKGEIETLSPQEAKDLLRLGVEQNDIITIAAVLEKLARGGDLRFTDLYDGVHSIDYLLHHDKEHLKAIYGKDPRDFLDDMQQEAKHNQMNDGKKIQTGPQSQKKIDDIMHLIDRQDYYKALGLLQSTLSGTTDPTYTTALNMKVIERLSKDKDFYNAMSKTPLGVDWMDKVYHNDTVNTVYMKFTKKMWDSGSQKGLDNMKLLNEFQEKFKTLMASNGIDEKHEDYAKNFALYLTGDEFELNGKIIKETEKKFTDGIQGELNKWMANEILKVDQDVENLMGGKLLKGNLFQHTSGKYAMTFHDMTANLRIYHKNDLQNIDWASQNTSNPMASTVLANAKARIQEQQRKVLDSIAAYVAIEDVDNLTLNTKINGIHDVLQVLEDDANERKKLNDIYQELSSSDQIKSKAAEKQLRQIFSKVLTDNAVKTFVT